MMFRDKPGNHARGAKGSPELRDAFELEIRLNMALGPAEDMSMYADCIRAARGKDRK